MHANSFLCKSQNQDLQYFCCSTAPSNAKGHGKVQCLLVFQRFRALRHSLKGMLASLKTLVPETYIITSFIIPMQLRFKTYNLGRMMLYTYTISLGFLHSSKFRWSGPLNRKVLHAHNSFHMMADAKNNVWNYRFYRYLDESNQKGCTAQPASYIATAKAFYTAVKSSQWD